MANVRDTVATSLWLHNKLGSSEPWTSGSVCSQFNPEVLRNIKECFIELQTLVKLKLLLSFFQIPRRNLEQWKAEIEDILEVALADSEQWVSMVAEIMKPFASSAKLNLEIIEPEENKKMFTDLINDVCAEIMRYETQMEGERKYNILPMECHYLNKMTLDTLAITNNTTHQEKHFVIKKKLKSAHLREELMQKAIDPSKSNNKIIHGPSIPIRIRGMPGHGSTTTHLENKGTFIPRSQFQEKSNTPGSLVAKRKSLPDTDTKTEVREILKVKILDITEQPLNFARNTKRGLKKGQAYEDAIKKSSTGVGAVSEKQHEKAKMPEYAAGLSVVNQSYPEEMPKPKVGKFCKRPSTSSDLLKVPMDTDNKPKQSVSDAAKYIDIPSPITTTPLIPNMATVPMKAKTAVILQVPTRSPQKIVTLSKELMEKAQEIFRTANKATRPEKEHILKFMAGTRENPCPHLGNIVTIMLSEHEENIRQEDGTDALFSVETFFQMNYATGEWKVSKKPPKSVEDKKKF